MKIHHLKQSLLSKSNSFDQNFMKLCHIVKYHNVFFKFDNVNGFDYNSMKLGHIIKYHNVFKFQNGPYCIMPSGVIALCS